MWVESTNIHLLIIFHNVRMYMSKVTSVMMAQSRLKRQAWYMEFVMSVSQSGWMMHTLGYMFQLYSNFMRISFLVIIDKNINLNFLLRRKIWLLCFSCPWREETFFCIHDIKSVYILSSFSGCVSMMVMVCSWYNVISVFILVHYEEHNVCIRPW